MVNKSHPLSWYKANSDKNKNNVWCILTLMLGFCPYQLTQDTTLWQVFLSNLSLFDSILSITVWINELHDFDEGISFLDNCWYENGKKHFYSNHSNGC